MASKSLRTRIIIVLYIISFTISLFIFSALMSRVSVDVECTAYSQYTVSGGDIYYAQNMKGTGGIFKMNGKGNVSRMYLTKSIGDKRILGITNRGDNIYAVLSSFIEEKDPNDPDAIKYTAAYRIICLDKKLALQTQTQKFIISDDEMISGFTADDKALFITTISLDGQNVRVYSVDVNQLKDPKDVATDALKVSSVRSKKATEGRFFADAIYTAEGLLVRTDCDVPAGAFAIDPYIQSAVSNMKLTIGQLCSLYSTYIIWYLAGLAIWFVVLYLLIKTFENRNRSFYYIVIAEATLFFIVLLGTIQIAKNQADARATEHSRFGIISLISLADEAGLTENIEYTDDFYDSERYFEIAGSLGEFVKREGNSDIFYDVFVYRLRDGIVCASGSGRNRQTLTEVYGQDLDSLANNIYRGQRYTAVDTEIEGQNYRAIAAAVDILAPEYALVGIINSTTTDATVFADNRGVILAFLLIYFLASALVVLVWFLHMRDITALEGALSATALGGEMPEKPVFIGRDIKDMWDSVTEIHKRIEEIEYAKIRILEAYFRFAPKNVEKVLGKKSILEVQSGDTCSIQGTISMIGLDLKGGKTLRKLDKMIENIGVYQKDHNSIIIGKAPDLSRLQLLYLNDEKQCVRSYIDLFGSSFGNSDNANISAVLFFDRSRFGVIGSEEESTTYMYSDNQDLITQISRFITLHGLGLVITETVKRRENINIPLRFVGYAGKDTDGNMVQLYEVLDVYSAKKRAERIATLDRYNEALRLFYEKDFYIARTKFSDILKETPDDDLVKWYVFEADRYLNENVEGDAHKIIHL